jgi:hypothetical protein
MPTRLFLLGLGALVCLSATGVWATEGTSFRGLFGPRTLGGPLAPQPGTRFDGGLVRGPSGEFHGLAREQRYGRAPSALRSAIPDTLRPTTVRPRVAPESVAPYPAYASEAPARFGPPPRSEPARPTDTWFRTRDPRAR